MDEDTQKIRDRAYQIWIESGQPDGSALEHWERAKRELGLETSPDGEGDRLDQGLAESFPSSDPVSEAQPGGGITGPGDKRTH